ncbi:MAG TPA: protease inhibitor I42 family protein [Anaerolineales bacterium]|nr:protease inhibitor I42 family protein [Anaerolineales bacterium]
MLRLTLIVFAGLLYACGAQGSSEQSTRQLTEADAGSSLELQVGETLGVTLPGNPTTGFQWEVDSVDSAILRQVGELEFEPSGNAVGSGGTVTLRFAAVGAGQTELKLIHRRPFEENVAPTQTFEVSVTVK